MKRLLAITLMLLSSHAVAQGTEWVARAPNNAGGQIVLLTVKGSCTTGMRMYTAAGNGNVTWGCWFATDTHVMVTWDTGQQRTSAFDYSQWEINPALDNKTPASKPRSTY